MTRQLNTFKIQDGDQIHIFPIAPYNEQAIYLQGHVLRPGRYSYHDGMKLTDLLASYSDLLPEPAAHYAEIVRLNAPDFRPSVESFDLSGALANPANVSKTAGAGYGPRLQPIRFRTGADSLGGRRSTLARQVPHLRTGSSS